MNTPILRISDFKDVIQRIITPETEGEAIPADAGFVSDRHPFFEILIALEGCSQYPLNCRLHTLTPGSAVLIPPWCRHSYGYRSRDTGLLHLWLHFSPPCHAGGVRVRRGGMTFCPEFAFTVSPELQTLFIRRWEFWEQSGKKGVENQFFRSILNLFLEEMQLQENYVHAPERDTVSAVLALIRNANGRGCSLEYLASQLGCSKYHLSHRVREETGRTIGDFIEESRLAYVKFAQQQGLLQKEIAGNLGFSSATAFGNWYHKLRNRKMKTSDQDQS